MYDVTRTGALAALVANRVLSNRNRFLDRPKDGSRPTGRRKSEAIGQHREE